MGKSRILETRSIMEHDGTIPSKHVQNEFEKNRSFSIFEGHRVNFLHGWARIPKWPRRIISQQLITPGATVAYPPVAWAEATQQSKGTCSCSCYFLSNRIFVATCMPSSKEGLK